MLSFETINELTLKEIIAVQRITVLKRYFLVHRRVSDRLYLDSLPEESQEKTFR